jgi:adenine phosphoribosyltransferase
LIFGAPLALALNIPFVPLRKPGKLPGTTIRLFFYYIVVVLFLILIYSSKTSAGETISATYETEYSTDKIEMHTGAVKEGQKVLLVDDLIATGGTLGTSNSFDIHISSSSSAAATITIWLKRKKTRQSRMKKNCCKETYLI